MGTSKIIIVVVIIAAVLLVINCSYKTKNNITTTKVRNPVVDCVGSGDYKTCCEYQNQVCQPSENYAKCMGDMGCAVDYFCAMLIDERTGKPYKFCLPWPDPPK
jgi:hypothetical protein